MEEIYQRLMSGNKVETLNEFRRLTLNSDEFKSDQLYNFLSFISNKDNDAIYNLFKKLEDVLYPHDIDYLEKSIYYLSDGRMTILFLGGMNKSFQMQHMEIIESLKSEKQLETIKLMALYLEYYQFDKIITSAKEKGVIISDQTLIDTVSSTDSPNKDAILLTIYSKSQIPNEETYEKLKELYVKLDGNDIAWDLLLNSPNAPYYTIFNALENVDFIEMKYHKWLKDKDYRAFLYEDYLYENGFTSEHRGLLAYILASGTIENFYRIMNVWRLESKDKKEELRIYYRANIHDALLDYPGVGFDIDEKYLEVINRKKQEKLEQAEKMSR